MEFLGRVKCRASNLSSFNKPVRNSTKIIMYCTFEL